MKKKIISALLAFGMLGAVTALADTEPQGAGYPSNRAVTSNNEIIGVYDKDLGEYVFDYYGELIFARYHVGIPEDETNTNHENLLYVSKIYKSVDGKIITDSDLEVGSGMKAYDIKNNKIFDDVWFDVSAVMPTATPVPTASPAPTTEPGATPEPTATPSATYNPNVFPEVYEKAINAVYAPAVIESVAQEVNDSQQGHRIEYYWQGTKHSDWFGSDVEIVTAPDSANAMIGADLSSLKRGDVVYLNRNMSGTITDIALIHQAQNQDVVNNTTDFGTNFEKLFSVQGENNTAVAGYSAWTVLKYGQTAPTKGNQYAFGVIGRRENTALYLINKTGNINSSIILQMADDAVVYECDMRNTSGIKISRPLSITSKIPSITWNNAYGTENPTIELTDDGYNYALARVVDGAVMDIVVYSNY